MKTTEYQKAFVIKLQVLTAAEVYFPWGSGSAIGEGEIHTVVFLSIPSGQFCPLQENEKGYKGYILTPTSNWHTLLASSVGLLIASTGPVPV